MKKYTLTFALIFSVWAGGATASAQTPLADLLKNRQYFELRDAVSAERTANASTLFYRGIVANRFNQPADSIALLQRYLSSGDVTNQREAYETLADDYLRTYQYSKAADTYKILIDRFTESASHDDAADYQNSYGLWNALRTAGRSTVTGETDSPLQGKRDKAKLLNVPVMVNGQTMDFVFDTGANLSTITVSTAKRLNLTLIETDVSVGTSSDVKVKSKLTVAPKMKIGAAIVSNVVFLVLEDEALHFPQIDYQINAIIGFPVMEALGRITLARSDQVTIRNGKSPAGVQPNMCLEALKPLLQASVNGKPEYFLLDSGAVTSTFYPPFFLANREQIEKNAVAKRIRIGGAGGFKEVSAYDLIDLKLTIAGKTATFPKTQVITESVNDDSKNFYGNLGQDLIKQFDRMTLDFRSMRIEFE
jgi:predicted aspartyl protease